MKLTASGGTDGASIVLFWPDNLPNNADDALKTDSIELVENLREEGKLIWFPCDGDGGYSVSIFVRSDVPEDLLVHCKDEEEIPALDVRGVGYFGGMEYMFKHDSSFLERYPHMCEQMKIPEGTYSARVFRTEIPDALYDSWLLEHAGARARRLGKLHSAVAACAVAGLAASLVALFVLAWSTWLYLAAIVSAFVVAAVAMSRTDWYHTVAAAKASFEKAYPSYVVQLK